MTDLAGKYVARNRFFAGGKHHAPGSELYLSHEEAKRAIEQGTVVVEKPEAPPHPAEMRCAELANEKAVLQDKVAVFETENSDIKSAMADAMKRIEELEGLIAQATSPAPTTNESTESNQGGEKPQGHAQAQAKGDKRK